jgi:hypothetical protein
MPLSNSLITVVDSSGNAIVVPVAAAVSTGGLMVMGSDGTNARFLSTDTSGRLVVIGQGVAGTPAGGVMSIQGVVGGTAIPISGSITATNPSVGTTGSAIPTSSTLIGGSDGTNLVALKVKPASTAAVAADPSLVVALSPNTPAKLWDGTNTAAVKAASTAPLATDPALVVTISPNSGSLSNPSVGTTGSAVPASATFIAASDGTNLQGLRVKPASTAALATDPALVVAISPNNPITVSGTADVTATGALGALNAAVQVATAGEMTVGLQLAAGTLIGTLVPEMSFDGGTTWNSTYFDTPSTQKVASVAFASSNTAVASSITAVAGGGLYRVRVSAYTSGTANVTLRATTSGKNTEMFTGPSGQLVPLSTALIGGSDGTNLLSARMKAASTAAVAADPALVVALSPNNPAKVWDGTNTAAVKAASTAAVAADPALVVSVSPNSKVKLFNQVTDGTVLGTDVYLPVAGKSDSGTMSALTLTAASALKVSLASFGQSLQANVTLTAGGTNGVGTAVYGNSVTLEIDVAGPVTGAGATLNFSLNEVALDSSTVIQTTSVAITAVGVYRLTLNNLYAYVSSTWTVSGSTPSFGGVTTTYTQTPGAVINGSGTIGQKAPTDALMMGASDGTNLLGLRVKPASTAAIATDPALVVAISPNNSFSSALRDSNSKSIRATVSQELKVAELYVLADLTNKYELDARLWDTLLVSGGTVTHQPTISGLRTATTTSATSSATLRTNTYYKYQAGFTQLATLSIIHSDSGQANNVREWGYFETNNGLFFRLSGTTLSIVERSDTSGSVADNVILQSAWNVDKMNGTGGSGVTLDLSKGNLFEIEIQWYGVGVVRYFINNILVHEQNHTNTLAVPYMRTAMLPVQVKVTNTAGAVASYVDLICARVVAQGQQHEPCEWTQSAYNTTDSTIGVTEVPLLSIRPKATYNSITNRSWIIPRRLNVNTEGNRMSFRIMFGATLTGPSWTSSSTTSLAEYDQTATAFSGGEMLFRGYIGQDIGEKEVDLSFIFDVANRFLRNSGFLATGTNANDVLTIVALNEAAGKTKARATLTWAEIR